MYLNPDQAEYVRELHRMDPAEKCWCGWYPKGKCHTCPPDKTCADKMAVQCPECHNDPGWWEGGAIIHRVGCSKSAQ
jgi:hypothetical protein